MVALDALGEIGGERALRCLYRIKHEVFDQSLSEQIDLIEHRLLRQRDVG